MPPRLRLLHLTSINASEDLVWTGSGVGHQIRAGRPSSRLPLRADLLKQFANRLQW